MNPHTLVAQRRGGHGAGTAGAPAGISSTDNLKDFQRAVAVQASPGQVVQFRRVTESTQVARQNVQDLLKLAENASKTDLFRSTNPLAKALEEAQTDNQKFLQSFSAVQKSGLKEITKKLGKASSDVTKRSKALTWDLERSGIAGQQISGVAEKLDKALSDLQARQLAMGSEMGIQSEGSSH
jgi:membrane-associated HD superfamily phosphohydrolase